MVLAEPGAPWCDSLEASASVGAWCSFLFERVASLSAEPNETPLPGPPAARADNWFAESGRALAWCVLGAALALLGVSLLATWSPAVDVVSHAKGHLIGLAIAAGLALMIGYRPMLVTSLGVFLTLAAHTLLGMLSEGPLSTPARAAASEASAWKIVSFNTWHSNRSHRRLVDFIDGLRADIVVLSEFGPDKIALLHDLERTYPHREGCADEWQCSVVILSRHPYTAAGVADRERSGGPPRAWMQFGSGPSSLTVIGAHLLRPIDGPEAHWRELDQLAAVASETEGRVIVAGDFNATPWSAGFSRFVTRSGLQHMDRFVPTFPAGRRGLPQLAIDHIFASPGMSITGVTLGPDAGSDHRPLLATIEIPSGVPIPLE